MKSKMPRYAFWNFFDTRGRKRDTTASWWCTGALSAPSPKAIIGNGHLCPCKRWGAIVNLFIRCITGFRHCGVVCVCMLSEREDAMQETEGESVRSIAVPVRCGPPDQRHRIATTTEDHYILLCRKCHSKTIHNACAFILFIITITAVAMPANQESKETIKRN